MSIPNLLVLAVYLLVSSHAFGAEKASRIDAEDHAEDHRQLENPSAKSARGSDGRSPALTPCLLGQPCREADHEANGEKETEPESKLSPGGSKPDLGEPLAPAENR